MSTRSRFAASIAARKQPRQRRSRQMVDAILEAALRAFERFGYEDATTRRIAELAGMSVGSLYQYFRSRDALLATILERHVAQVLEELELRFRRFEREPLHVLARQLVAAVVALHARSPRLHAVLAGNEPKMFQDPLLKRLDRAIASMLSTYWARHPELPPFDIERGVFAINRACIGLLHQSDERAGPDPQAERDMVWLVLGYLACATGLPLTSRPSSG